MSLRSIVPAALIALAVAQAPSAGAVTVTLQPSQDTTIFSDSEGNASGAGAFAFAGTTAGGTHRRALLRFDSSGIDPESIVNSASFRFTVDRATGSTSTMSLHRLLASWGEGASDGGSGGAGAGAEAGDATWIHRFHGDPVSVWQDASGVSSPGGWFVAEPSATRLVGGPDTYAWTDSPTGGLAADVQAWIRNPATNFGWILIGDESTDRSAKRFYTSEAEDAIAALRPTLILEVTPVPEPATTGLLVVGGAWLAMRIRRKSAPARAARRGPFGA